PRAELTASARETAADAAARMSGRAVAAGRGGGRLAPAVRRLLAEHALTAADVPGTGPEGRITVEDVLRAAAEGPGAPPRPGGASASVTAPAVPAASRSVPHSAVRKRIAEHMVQSLLHSAPHVTTVFDVDMTAVLADRARQREEFARRGAPLTLTAYF